MSKRQSFLIVVSVAVVAAIAAVAGTALVLGNGDDPAAGGSDSSESTAAEFVESEDCRLAGVAWLRAARADVSDAVFEVPFEAPDARSASTDQAKVLCSAGLYTAVTEADYELATLNLGLTVCQNVPVNCDRAANEAQRATVEPLVAAVAELLDAKA